jgi:protein ImuB
VCIWLPNWPIQRLLVTRPELKGQPVVLHETRRGIQRVVACSARAMAFGVTVGMPLAEATALAGQGEREKGEGRREKREEGGAKRQSPSLMVDANGLSQNVLPSPSLRGEGSGVRGFGIGFRPPAAFPLPSSPLGLRPSPLAPCPRALVPGPWPLAPRPSDPLADREALGALAEWCGWFSPIVGLEDSPAAESLLLDITGLAHLFRGEASLAEKIIHDFACRGLVVRVAVADTIGAAWAAAHYQRRKAEGGRRKDLLASRRSEENVDPEILNPAPRILNPSPLPLPPSAFVILPPGEVLPALRPLPVAALRLPEETVELLRQLGIRRIEQLEALPREGLSSRFGSQLLRRWDQATGRLAEPVPALRQSPKLEAQWSSEHPTARRETIEAALEQLIGQVAEMLARLGRGAIRLECRLDCSSAGATRAGPVRVGVGLFRPTAAAGHLFSLARLQLERLRLPGPLSGIHVAATATAPLLDQQEELFFCGDGVPRRHPRYLAELVERLSSRLGRRSVLRVRLLADAQPELAFRYEPLVDGSRRRAPQGATGVLSRGATGVSPVPGARHGQDARGTRPRQAPSELPPRPLRLLLRPVALEVTSILPGGPPVRFRSGGRDHRIAQHWGPERIETGWWRNRVVGRDYYQVETITGGRLWLFRRLRDGKWFLHGMFE